MPIVGKDSNRDLPAHSLTFRAVLADRRR